MTTLNSVNNIVNRGGEGTMSVQVAVITETVDPFNSSLVSPKEVFVL